MLLLCMFTDTHCHMTMVKQRGCDMASLVQELVTTNVPFVLDIGTEAHDLPKHIAFIENLIESNLCKEDKHRAYEIFHFSAGLWPSRESIARREEYVKIIEQNVLSYKDTHSICAIGECGLDRNWNKADGQGFIDGAPAADILAAEEELFEMQIALAKKLDLPVIVHSRDAPVETFNCIKNIGWQKGIIHCYSYGIDEVKMFLDYGYYISLSGTVTYAKKNQLDTTKELINYIPKDMLLLETDAPYLAPTPMRGKTNTPIMVKYVYDFVSNMLGISNEDLARIVLENTKKVFAL